MKKIAINSTHYDLVKDFKHDAQLRKSFNQLTRSTFGFSLENWYQDGFWGDYYVPYALMREKQVVSNVSINRLEFLIDNQLKVGLQIGTVMTAESYRNKGLSRLLLMQVIDEWRDQCDFIYLFANDTVLGFYPKFNFEQVREYQYAKSIRNHSTYSPVRKLNVDEKADRSLLIDMIDGSVPISPIALRNGTSLLMFYCTLYKKHCIYYLKDHQAIVIADFQGGTLILDEVFSKNAIDLDNLIQTLSNSDVRRVVLGFTPLEDSGYERNVLTGGDTLFILNHQAGLFKDHNWMFQVLSHA